MSQPDDEPLMSLYHSLHIGVITELAASVLFFYDYALTFPGEVRCIWQRRFSGITALFALARYAVLLERVARLIQLKSWRGFNFQQADLFCNVAWRWSEFATIVMYLSITVFSALRTYAVLSRYKGAFIFVLGVGVSGLIYGIYYATRITFQAMHTPFTGCGQDAVSGDGPNLQFLGVGTISTMIIEVLALVLSWRETAGTMSVLRTFNMSTKMSYTALLWRDGTIYSVILVILTVLPVAIPVTPNSESLPAVMDTLLSICLSRFILHLRAFELSGDVSTRSLHLSQMTDLHFTQPGTVSGSVEPSSHTDRDVDVPPTEDMHGV